VSSADVLLDFDREYLGGAHLAIKELDDSAQLPWNLVSDEHEAELSRSEICLEAVPEAGRVGVCADVISQRVFWVKPIRRAALFKREPKTLDAPIDDGVRRVVQDLADHLAADAGVGAALDLDERWDGILVDEEVIDVPAAGAALVASK
jgi:hypothetical protein